MLRAFDSVPTLSGLAHSRLEDLVYKHDLLGDYPSVSTAFCSPLLPFPWEAISFIGGAAAESHRLRNVQFASLFVDPYLEWEASSAITTVGALSLAPLEVIACRLWNSLSVDPSAKKSIHQPNSWPITPPNVHSIPTSYDLGTYGVGASVLTFCGQDQALYTTLTAPLWTLPFRELPFVVDFRSIPNAVAYIFYGIGLVRDIVAGRALRDGSRRRLHRGILSSTLRRLTKLVRRFSKLILFQHQRRSPASADSDAHEASLSPIHREEIVEAALDRRMLNVHPGKFSIRHNRRVRSQSVCNPKYRNRFNSICSYAGKKGVDRLARYSRSVA